MLDALLDGSVNLTTVGILAPHLTADNCALLLTEARHKRKEDVQRIVARLRPQPDAASVVRKLPAPRPVSAVGRAAGPALQELEPPPGAVVAALISVPPVQRAVVAPLAPERYKLQVTIDEKTREVLRQAQDLMRHSNPSGDPAVVIARALRVLVDDLLKKKAAPTERPGRARTLIEGSGTIPAAVKRAVWKRDGGRCAFDASRGKCNATDGIEYHHMIPYALGGEATADNIELRCRAHNAYQARLDGLGWNGADVNSV